MFGATLIHTLRDRVRGAFRLSGVLVLAVCTLAVFSQEIDEVVPPGEGRFLVLASRGTGDISGLQRRTVTLRMLASDGVRTSIVVPESADLRIAAVEEDFSDWVLRIRDRLRLILQDQGYTVGRKTVFRRDSSDDILAVDSIEIDPPPGVSIIALDFEVRPPGGAAADTVEYDLFLEYQSFVTPDPAVTADFEWRLFSKERL